MHYIPFSLSVLHYPQLGGRPFFVLFLNLDSVFPLFLLCFLYIPFFPCPCACLHLVYVYFDSSAYEFPFFHGIGSWCSL